MTSMERGGAEVLDERVALAIRIAQVAGACWAAERTDKASADVWAKLGRRYDERVRALLTDYTEAKGVSSARPP